MKVKPHTSFHSFMNLFHFISRLQSTKTQHNFNGLQWSGLIWFLLRSLLVHSVNRLMKMPQLVQIYMYKTRSERYNPVVSNLKSLSNLLTKKPISGDLPFEKPKFFTRRDCLVEGKRENASFSSLCFFDMFLSNECTNILPLIPSLFLPIKQAETLQTFHGYRGINK